MPVRTRRCYALGQVIRNARIGPFLGALLFGATAVPGVAAADDLARGYATIRDRDVEWVFPESHASKVTELRAVHRDAWTRVTEDLGVDIDPQLTIRVARNPREMQFLAPSGYAPPAYATGVAYPNRGLILLTLSAPETWEPPELDLVLTHEISHVALYRAVQGRPLPLWFTEGLAVYQSNAFRMHRMRALLRGALLHEVLPLSHLSHGFPERPYDINIAYAQSADIVGFLRRDSADVTRFGTLIRTLRRGVDFDEALSASYGWTLDGLERAWRDSLRKRYRIAPLLFGASTIWSLMAVLLVFAWRRRRKDAAHKLRKMEAEEALADWQYKIATEGAENASAVSVEHEIPRVEHDGGSHTLH